MDFDIPLILHSGFLIHHAYICHYLSQSKDLEGNEAAKEAKQFGPNYMTSWNMFFQVIYLLIAIYLDVLKYLPKTKSRVSAVQNLQVTKGYLFSSVCFPITLMTSTIFWGLYSLDEEYVIKGLRQFMPSWLNHSIHTNILLVVFAELLLIKHSFPKPSFKAAMAVVIAIGVVYFIQFMAIYCIYDRFLYGVFNILSWPGRLGFTLFIHVLSVAYLKLGYVLQNVIGITNKPKSN